MAIRSITEYVTIQLLTQEAEEAIDGPATLDRYSESLADWLQQEFPGVTVEIREETGRRRVDCDTDEDAAAVQESIEHHFSRGGFYVLPDGSLA